VRWCKDCRTHHFDRESCYPIFELFYDEWYGDEWQEIRGRTMEEAVEKWAEDADCGGDYTIIAQRDEPLVRVRPKGCHDEREWQYFVVTGESVPQYTVTESKLCGNPACQSKGDERAGRHSSGWCWKCFREQQRASADI